MLQHTVQGEELMELALAVETHLAEAGHEVKTLPNEGVTSFDVTPAAGGDMLCRVQAVGRETWEIARVDGETLTGLGDRNAFLRMVENVVAAQIKKAA